MSAGAVRGGERKQKMTVLRHMGLSIGARVPLNPQTHTQDSRTPPPPLYPKRRTVLTSVFFSESRANRGSSGVRSTSWVGDSSYNRKRNERRSHKTAYEYNERLPACTIVLKTSARRIGALFSSRHITFPSHLQQRRCHLSPFSPYTVHEI